MEMPLQERRIQQSAILGDSRRIDLDRNLSGTRSYGRTTSVEHQKSLGRNERLSQTRESFNHLRRENQSMNTT